MLTILLWYIDVFLRRLKIYEIRRKPVDANQKIKHAKGAPRIFKHRCLSGNLTAVNQNI